MFCTHCGKQIPDGFLFCIHCGTRVAEVEAPAQAPVAETETPAAAPAPEAPAVEPETIAVENVVAAVSEPMREQAEPERWYAVPEYAQPEPVQTAPAQQTAAYVPPEPVQQTAAYAQPEPVQQAPAYVQPEPAQQASPYARATHATSAYPTQTASYEQAGQTPAPAPASDTTYDKNYDNYVQQVQKETPTKEFKMGNDKKPKTKLIVGIVAVVAVAALVVAGVLTNGFGLFPADSSDSSSGSSSASASASSTSASASATSSSASASAASASASSAATSVTVKKSVNDYSWDELSKISAEISQAKDEKAALEIAKKYNLTTKDGKLDGTQTKTVEFASGSKFQATIVGFYHDDKADGSGKAGITFIFKNAVATKKMNDDATNSGGWKASSLRTWLNEDFISRLPEDLQKNLVPVTKMTNNVGQTKEAKSVSATEDKVWIPAFTELRPQRKASDYKDDQQYRAAVYNAEGTIYQLFQDVDFKEIGVKNTYSNNKATPCNWWNRTPLPGNKTQFVVTSKDGVAGHAAEANEGCGVVPGFCI